MEEKEEFSPTSDSYEHVLVTKGQLDFIADKCCSLDNNDLRMLFASCDISSNDFEKALEIKEKRESFHFLVRKFHFYNDKLPRLLQLTSSWCKLFGTNFVTDFSKQLVIKLGKRNVDIISKCSGSCLMIYVRDISLKLDANEIKRYYRMQSSLPYIEREERIQDIENLTKMPTERHTIFCDSLEFDFPTTLIELIATKKYDMVSALFKKFNDSEYGVLYGKLDMNLLEIEKDHIDQTVFVCSNCSAKDLKKRNYGVPSNNGTTRLFKDQWET